LNEPKTEGVESFDVVMDLSDIVSYDFAAKFANFNVFHINNPLEMYRSADKRTYVDRYSEFIPETVVSSDVEELERVLHERFGGEMIVKDPFGSCGVDVEKVTKNDDYMSILLKMTENGTKKIVAQKFMHYATKGSKRVAVVGKVGDDVSYRVVHFYGRKPLSGEWKDNLSQGGSVVEFEDIREDEKELCLNVAKRSGLYLVGLDIMDDIDKDGKRVPKLVETNSVLALAKGRYPEKLNEVVDFIVDDLLK
jgi:glutathione synthase/RimK-type ligase-like ATP-grasp enzyme